jgi:OHCU decarboxylase
MSLSLSRLNQLDRMEFVAAAGSIFEHSPWVAAGAWQKRPFATAEALRQVMCEIVRNTAPEKQLALIRAHPDLVGRAALAGTLTRESTKEQTSAGLNKLSPEETKLFQKQNTAYHKKFGFPFVICARLNKREAILAGFEKRLQNTREEEIQIALEEIFKIAELRLRDLISD